MSRRHVSGSSSRSQTHAQAQPIARSTSSSPRKHEVEPPTPQPGPVSNLPPLHPRQRLASIIASGLDPAPQGVGSPLKQALAPFPSIPETYQPPMSPLGVEMGGTSGESSNVQLPVSYGPATRQRRLSSMAAAGLQRAPSGLSAAAQHHRDQHQHHHGEPTSPTTRRPPLTAANAQNRLGLLTVPLSQSPDEHGVHHTSPEAFPSRQLEAEDVDESFHTRLERMEESQRRMEDLLVRLASKLN